MKLKLILHTLILFLSISLNAQEKPKESQAPVYSAALKAGDLLNLGRKSFKFKEVVSDSRCPRDVTCVWAGEAKVRVEIFENGSFLEEKIVSINSGEITLNFATEDVIYSISEMALTPYPTVKTKIAEKDYTLQVKVTESL